MSAAACVDASIIAKLVLTEADSDQAEALFRHLRRSALPVAPLHLHAEITSAVYKRVRDGVLTLEEGSQALDDLAIIALELDHPDGVAQRALRIAAQLKLKYTYDALYLALGELLDCDVWTADRQLWDAAHSAFPRLRLLSSYGAQ